MKKHIKVSVKKPAQDAQEPVHGTEPEKVSIAPVEVQEKPKTQPEAQKIATHAMWLYHDTLPAKVFNSGEIIPEGWQDRPFPKEEVK